MPTDEKTPFMSYPEMPYPEIVKASVKDAVAAANAAAVEAARAKKRTADAATEAVNSSLVYVARKLMKHALKRCSAAMRAEDGMRGLVDAVKMTDQLVPRIMWDAQIDYRNAKRRESEAAMAAVVAGNAAAAAVSSANLHLRPVEFFEAINDATDATDEKGWMDRYEDAEEHEHACFVRGFEAANKDIDSIAAKCLIADDTA